VSGGAGAGPPTIAKQGTVAVLTCYLDDSGTHDESPLVTMAGYIMDDKGWAVFELNAELICEKRGFAGRPLHAVDMQQNNPPYEDWSVLNKQAFIAQLCLALKPHGPLGLSLSVTREFYERRAQEAGRSVVYSPYAWAFQVILNWILTSVQVGKKVREEGVRFVVEQGSKNNDGIAHAYEYVVRTYADELGDTLRGLEFVPKGHSRAIQMADLLAYYSYRRGMHLRGLPMDMHPSVALDPVMKVMLETGPHQCVVANDFGWREPMVEGPSRAQPDRR